MIGLSHCSSLWVCAQPFSRQQRFPRFVAALLLTKSGCLLALSASQNKVAILKGNCRSIYLKSWKGWIKKARVSCLRVLGCKLDETQGHSRPFMLPVGAQFVGGGAGTAHACRMQGHPARRSHYTGFCAMVCKPGWKISVTSKYKV